MAGMFSRAMFQIGARRFVLEFRTSVTELHPVDTQVIAIARGKPKQKGALPDTPPGKPSGKALRGAALTKTRDTEV